MHARQPLRYTYVGADHDPPDNLQAGKAKGEEKGKAKAKGKGEEEEKEKEKEKANRPTKTQWFVFAQGAASLVMLLAVLLLLTLPTAAQDATPAPDAQPITNPQALDAAIATAQAAAHQASTAADEAATRTDQAFNLLGLFESLGLVVTVVGGALGVFGFWRLISAQNELTKARQEVEEELATYRERFEQVSKERQDQFDEMQKALDLSTKSQRDSTSMALLANALLPIGERQYKTQDYKGAINTYERALELDVNNPVTHQRLGYVYTQSGQLDKAKYHYEEAIRREENFAPALAGLGFVYRRMGEALDKRITQEPDPAKAPIERVIERDKLINRAEQLLLQALEISPRLVDDDGESWWGVMGGLYKRRGQINDAINAYRNATTVTPQSSYGFGNLALLYLKQQDVDRMLETYKRVERIAATEAQAETGNFWGYSDLIVSRFAQGKIEAAELELPIAIEIAPTDSPYMLSGLSETLQELVDVVDDQTRVAIRRAVSTLESVLAQRAQDTKAKEETALRLAEETSEKE